MYHSTKVNGEPGVIYTIGIDHYATKNAAWDFDYLLRCSPPAGYGVVVDDPEGIFGSHSDRGSGTVFADAGKTARIGVVRIGLCADYDRRNGIDSNDMAVRDHGGASGRLYHWVNDNRSSGSGWDAVRDLLPWGAGDAQRDSRVNGVCDTLDFTPVWFDLGPAVDLLDRMGVPFELRVSHPAEAVNLVWTSLTRAEAGSFLTNNVSGCGPGLSQDLISASVQRAEAKCGATAPSAFLDLIRDDGEKGVVLIEGRLPSSMPLTLSCVRAGTGASLVTTNLSMRISAVGDMFRWVDIREASENPGFEPAVPASPDGLPDAACNQDMFVFVHGYNINHWETRAWAGEFFKRLRQSGSSSRFTGVTWQGNYSQLWAPSRGLASPNYYYNVRNAFMSSSALDRAVRRLPGARRFIAAHSLGNMLVSAAVVDQSMPYDRYFMLNAAVPQEAYSADAVTEESIRCMTATNWIGYPVCLRASRWYDLFDGDDPRRGLTWKGRFSGISNAVNYFSSEDEVLENGDGTDKSVFDRRFAWYNQEMGKGRGLTSVMTEAGWGFNHAWYVTRHGRRINHGTWENYTYSARRRPDEAVGLDTTQLRECPFFSHFGNRDIYAQPGLATNYEYRASLLSRAIPAESFATGRNPMPRNIVSSVDIADIGKDVRNDYLMTTNGMRAVHSFLVGSSFMYNHGLYDDVVRKSVAQ